MANKLKYFWPSICLAKQQKHRKYEYRLKKLQNVGVNQVQNKYKEHCTQKK